MLESFETQIKGELDDFEVPISWRKICALAQSFWKLIKPETESQPPESGLQYEVIEASDGPSPNATDNVEVHYSGTFIDGGEFDSSYKRGVPAQFPLDRVISGWTEGVQLMSVGSKFRFFIPFGACLWRERPACHRARSDFDL